MFLAVPLRRTFPWLTAAVATPVLLLATLVIVLWLVLLAYVASGCQLVVYFYHQLRGHQ